MRYHFWRSKYFTWSRHTLLHQAVPWHRLRCHRSMANPGSSPPRPGANREANWWTGLIAAPFAPLQVLSSWAQHHKQGTQGARPCCARLCSPDRPNGGDRPAREAPRRCPPLLAPRTPAVCLLRPIGRCLSLPLLYVGPIGLRAARGSNQLCGGRSCALHGRGSTAAAPALRRLQRVGGPYELFRGVVGCRKQPRWVPRGTG